MFTNAPNFTERFSGGGIDCILDKRYATRQQLRATRMVQSALCAIEPLADEDSLETRWKRQAKFLYHGKPFKVRFSSNIGVRGGIEIVRQVCDRKSRHSDRRWRDNRRVLELVSLRDARQVTEDLKAALDCHLYGLFA